MKYGDDFVTVPARLTVNPCIAYGDSAVFDDVLNAAAEL
jgi:hypothetical protein